MKLDIVITFRRFKSMDLKTRKHSPYINKHVGRTAAICPHRWNVVELKVKFDTNISFVDEADNAGNAFLYARPVVELCCPQCGHEGTQKLVSTVFADAAVCLFRKGYEVLSASEDYELLNPDNGERTIMRAHIAISNVGLPRLIERYPLPKSWGECSNLAIYSLPDFPIKQRAADIEKWAETLPRKEKNHE